MTDTMVSELTEIRSQLKQSHTWVAAKLLDSLITELTAPPALLSQPSVKAMRKATNGKVPNGRCPYARYTQAGNLLKRHRHHCTPACTWTAAEVSEWLRTTPYCVGPNEYIQSRLVPVPPCANCNRKRGDHWEPAADKVTGRLTGFRAIKECEYMPTDTKYVVYTASQREDTP